jgi:hypothetical protein
VTTSASTTTSTAPAPVPTPTSAPAKERVSFAALASAPMPGLARGRGHSGPLLHQRHMSDEVHGVSIEVLRACRCVRVRAWARELMSIALQQGKAKEAQADVSSTPAKEANAFVASGGRYVEEGTLKIQTKYAFISEPLPRVSCVVCRVCRVCRVCLRGAVGSTLFNPPFCRTGWAKYAFRLYTNGHLAYFHPDFVQPPPRSSAVRGACDWEALS